MKITKLFFLGLVVLFFSCSEDEAPLPTTEAMTGTWRATAIDYSGSTTSKFMGESMKATFTGKGKDIDYTTTFNTDPNTVVSEGSYTIELKTTFAGETETTEEEFNEVLMDGTWELDGKTLTVTSGDVTQEATITKQTDTDLEVRINLTQTEGDSDLGITITTKVKAVYKFKKADL